MCAAIACAWEFRIARIQYNTANLLGKGGTNCQAWRHQLRVRIRLQIELATPRIPCRAHKSERCSAGSRAAYVVCQSVGSQHERKHEMHSAANGN